MVTSQTAPTTGGIFAGSVGNTTIVPYCALLPMTEPWSARERTWFSQL